MSFFSLKHWFRWLCVCCGKRRLLLLRERQDSAWEPSESFISTGKSIWFYSMRREVVRARGGVVKALWPDRLLENSISQWDYQRTFNHLQVEQRKDVIHQWVARRTSIPRISFFCQIQEWIQLNSRREKRRFNFWGAEIPDKFHFNIDLNAKSEHNFYSNNNKWNINEIGLEIKTVKIDIWMSRSNGGGGWMNEEWGMNGSINSR